ncbi:MAG: hypothetical protein JXX28_11640 [Deltaproteobacteria bacterium]|nr:hypothetical protein [Deltaproteobacteria bacterium]
MLIPLILLACGLSPADSDEPDDTVISDDTHAPEDTGPLPPAHPCEVDGREVSWVQLPVESGETFGEPAEPYHYLLADDFTVPEEDGCWCVREVRIWGQATDGSKLYWPVAISLAPAASTGAPHASVLDSAVGDAFSTGEQWQFAEGSPLVFHPVNEDPESSTPAHVVLKGGKHWLATDPGSFFVQPQAFAWRVGQPPDGTDAAWIHDPDAILAESAAPDWTPWPDASSSSTVRDLAFEVHASTDEAACAAWLEEHGSDDPMAPPP